MDYYQHRTRGSSPGYMTSDLNNGESMTASTSRVVIAEASVRSMQRALPIDCYQSPSPSTGRSKTSSATYEAFGNVPGVTKDLAQLAIQANRANEVRASATSPQSRTREPKEYYHVAYIRGEWMQQLLDNGIGKRRVKFYLSDETLCLGTSEAPITSEFRRPTIFYEAFKHGEQPSDAKIYMADYQVDWLVDELYAKQAVNNAKLEYKLVDVDRSSKAVKKEEFAAFRKITFAQSVSKFRDKCGLSAAMTSPTPKPASQKPMPTSSPSPPVPEAMPPPLNDRYLVSAPSIAPSAASMPALRPIQVPDPPRTTPIAPPPFATSGYAIPSSKIDRQMRLKAKQEEYLRLHIAAQKDNYSKAQTFYANLCKYGGVVMACDVESWTKDAEVLMELGISWKRWQRVDDVKEAVTDSANRHFIIEEAIQYQNEEIEATRDDYAHGQSEILPRAVVEQRLQSLIAEMSKFGPLVLVFHDASAECRYFQKLGVDVANYLTTIPEDQTYERPARWPRGANSDGDENILIQDTQNLYCGWSEPPVKQVNLQKACTILGVEATKLHNAGNDAIATLKVWERLSAGNMESLRLTGEDTDVVVGETQDMANLLESKVDCPKKPLEAVVEHDLIEL